MQVPRGKQKMIRISPIWNFVGYFLNQKYTLLSDAVISIQGKQPRDQNRQPAQWTSPLDLDDWW